MNSRTMIYVAAAVAALAAAGAQAKSTLTATDAASPAFTGHELAGKAKVTLAQARAKALAARPGAITDQELEKEHGGSGLRYSFDVAVAGATYEVGVDAVSGKILENAREGAHPD
jgi:uncharacterized membrane protein YkoI